MSNLVNVEAILRANVGPTDEEWEQVATDLGNLEIAKTETVSIFDVYR